MTPFDDRPSPADPSTPVVTLGFPPIDHAAPETDDVPRHTHRRSILAHVFTTIVAGFYLATRVVFDVNQSAARSSNFPTGWILLAVVPIVLIHFLIEVLRWRAFTFRVNEHRLVIDRGIFTRHHIVVPFDRVQQVDINRRLTAIILGLAAVRIDTAGMDAHTSVQLRYLDPKEANGLRAFILQHRDLRATDAAADTHAAEGRVTPAPTEETLLTLGPKRLIVAALTHHTNLILLPTLFVLALWAMAVTSLTSDEAFGALFLGLGAIAFAVFVVLAAVQGLIGTVVHHWGFTLSHTGDDLHLRFGLTDQRHLTVPRRRIQHVEVIDNPVRRALGLVSVHLHSAASDEGAGKKPTRFEIPVLRRAELAAVLPLIIGDPHFHVPDLTPRPPGARRRAVTRRCTVLALAVGLPALALRPAGLALFGIVLIGIPWGLAAHRRAGHARTPAVAVVAHGVLHHRVVLVPISRLQSAQSSSSPFQRRAHLQTLYLDVARAPSAPRLFDMDASTADQFRRELNAPTPGAPDEP